MKRWLAVFVLLLLLLPGCAPAQKAPRWRLVEERFGVVHGIAANAQVYSYDEDGRLSYSALLGRDGEAYTEMYYSYEQDGKNVWKIQKVEMNGIPRSGMKELLDKDGNVLECWNETEDGEYVLWKRFEYDKNGNTISERSFGNDGNVQYTYCWEFDKHGNETRMISYRGTDDTAVTYDKETFYTYDENGWPLEVMVCYTGRPGIMTLYTNTYREDGTLECRVGLYEDNTYIEERYNAAGMMERTEYFTSNGVSQTKTVWEFDEYGNVVASEEWNGAVMFYRKEMVYDTY